MYKVMSTSMVSLQHRRSNGEFNDKLDARIQGSVDVQGVIGGFEVFHELIRLVFN